DIEADSTILADQQQEQQQRIQFVQAAGQYLQQALPLVQANPNMAPLAGHLLLFAIRSFPKGAELEGLFEAAIKQFQQAPQQAPPPDPKAALAQAQIDNLRSQIANRNVDNMREGQESQHRMQLEMAKAGVSAEAERRASDREAERLLHEHEMDRRNVMLD